MEVFVQPYSSPRGPISFSVRPISSRPVEVILAQSEQGRGVLGVIDGFSPKGVEEEKDRVWRKDLLRKFGYKM